ncbi:MAG: hypothetical protein HYR56_16925 [Acidobacteria bacterium]|nr:hypothetical protein [Acidobacteriota bacterium]MBI3428017.1 hypothetical protein [Acidobacteriota bacterium]
MWRKPDIPDIPDIEGELRVLMSGFDVGFFGPMSGFSTSTCPVESMG